MLHPSKMLRRMQQAHKQQFLVASGRPATKQSEPRNKLQSQQRITAQSKAQKHTTQHTDEHFGIVFQMVQSVFNQASLFDLAH